MTTFNPRGWHAAFAFSSMILTVLATTVGCGGAPSYNPGITVHPAQATVTYNGSPVEGALVSFSSIDGQRSAFGTTNAEGVAELTTFDPADGAVPGEHRVIITKDVVEVLKEADPNDPTSAAVTKTNRLLPTRYGDFRKSGLTAVVKEGENSFTFELKD